MADSATGKIFFSYRRNAVAIVEPIVEALGESDFNVWVDTSEIERTADWWREIRDAIIESDAVVAALTDDYLTLMQTRRVETRWAVL